MARPNSPPKKRLISSIFSELTRCFSPHADTKNLLKIKGLSRRYSSLLGNALWPELARHTCASVNHSSLLGNALWPELCNPCRQVPTDSSLLGNALWPERRHAPFAACRYSSLLGNALWPELDRVDSSLGYTAANCDPCCSDCNYAKREMSRASFLNLIAKIHAHQSR